ncbi:MAG: hypothetical protein KDH96_08160, partial [Candidatus Riesia sp.]|nr:hypothetical protein [Candidatus Riesia sp.]
MRNRKNNVLIKASKLMPDKNEIQTSIAVIQSQMDTFAKNQTYLMGQVSSIKDLLQQELSSIRTEFNNNIKEHAKENELRLKELHLQMDDKLKAQKE